MECTLSHKNPAMCVKELHSTEQEHANTHRLFIKLCSTRPLAASCGCIRSGGAVAASNKLSCRATRGRPRHSLSLSAWTVARWTRADRARGQGRRRLAGAALARAHSSRHVRGRLGHHDDDPAAHGRPGRSAEPKQTRTSVDPSLGHGQHPRQ